MSIGVSGPRSHAAKFVPEHRKGLARPSAVEWMVMITGIALCSIGIWGVMVGVPIALAGFYSGFFVTSKVGRGLYFGQCPHCDAPMSATHYQERLDCPSCGRFVRVHDAKFEAIDD